MSAYPWGKIPFRDRRRARHEIPTKVDTDTTESEHSYAQYGSPSNRDDPSEYTTDTEIQERTKETPVDTGILWLAQPRHRVPDAHTVELLTLQWGASLCYFRNRESRTVTMLVNRHLTFCLVMTERSNDTVIVGQHFR